MLFNVGFREALKDAGWTCLAFHDVDQLPENDKNTYSCPKEGTVRHMSLCKAFGPTQFGVIFAMVNSPLCEQPWRSLHGHCRGLYSSQRVL